MEAVFYLDILRELLWQFCCISEQAFYLVYLWFSSNEGKALICCLVIALDAIEHLYLSIFFFCHSKQFLSIIFLAIDTSSV